jgi:gluconokinase
MIVILMGVCGIGKTTIGKLFSALTGWKFEDADDYHSQQNREKMASGIPLTDEDRVPWLTALHERMSQYRREGECAIFACSALKQEYRKQLTGNFKKDEIRLVYLHAPVALIQNRIKLRDHAYMNPGLLDSQLATLEEPPDAWPVSVSGTAEQSTEEILTLLRENGMLRNGVTKE